MKGWEGSFEMPFKGRSTKPRRTGITMVIDKGLGIRQTEDLMEMAADYIDVLKLTFGTSAFYDYELLKKKVSLVIQAGVDIMPGGTFLEVAVWQGSYDKYLARAKELGFTAIEVSDGTIAIDEKTRVQIIEKALKQGFKVISEVGKKDPREAIAIPKMQEEIKNDLGLGVFKVLVEAREAGKGVGIYTDTGAVKEEEVDKILSGVKDSNDLIWEAPLKNQQLYLITRFGINVNLGNIPPEDIIALEALRCGLRGDTLKKAYLEKEKR